MDRTLEELVWRRAGGCREYCRTPQDVEDLPAEIDHIIAEVHGGRTAASNLALSCPLCNGQKYAKTHSHDPQIGRFVPLFNPRRQRWTRHFAWGADFLLIEGRTAVGRATVAALHLNSPALVNLRRAFGAVGEHPPPAT